jgi:signal transduction histidine kinase
MILATSNKILPRQTRLVLWTGFGGLLLLMAFAGIDAIHQLRAIQSRTEEVQRDFVDRDRLLHEIRSDLYVSGTYVRDYLLEPEPQNAAAHLKDLGRARQQMDMALSRYARMVSPPGAAPFLALNRALLDYWQVLNPVFQWNPTQRRENGYAFLRDELLPRRVQMLTIADQIAEVNERQLAVRNERVSELYTQLQKRMAFTISITLMLGLALAAFSGRRILQLETEAGQRYREIEEARKDLKELSARLVNVQESERRSISRELHDEIGQSLSALLVGLSNLRAAVPETAKLEVQRHIEGLRRLAETSMASIRNMALLLRPSMLDDLGLVPALEWQARETSRQTGLIVNVHADDLSDNLPEEYRTCVYRVVQEALHNISRHASARTADIDVIRNGNHLRLSIQDDGSGFDPRHQRGLGLLGMQERITHLGGEFNVQSEAGRGTRIEIVIPLEASL